MSESSSATQRKKLSGGWKALRFLHGVLIFLIVGPPIGSLIFTVWGFAEALKSSLWTHAHPSRDLFGVLVVMPFLFAFASYILGWLPALIAGIVVSFEQVYSNGMSLRNAAIAAILTSPIAPAFSHMNDRGGSAHAPTIWLDALLAIASITATMSCWWILRKGGISGYESK
ncbi:MAG: hypothetical protein Q7V17_20865 [Afipia sp.]|nr:hypothetical protein [Afipia sp.]